MTGQSGGKGVGSHCRSVAYLAPVNSQRLPSSLMHKRFGSRHRGDPYVIGTKKSVVDAGYVVFVVKITPSEKVALGSPQRGRQV